MPPKAAASLDDALKRLLENPDSPSESDFKVLLAAASPKSDDKQKTSAATYITDYIEKFPKQQKAAIDALIQLADCDSYSAKLNAVRNLKKVYTLDKNRVIDALINAFADESDQICDTAYETLERNLKSDEELKTVLLEKLSSAKSKSQTNLVRLITSNVQFNEENVKQLLDVLDAALKSSVLPGLQLYRKYRKIIPNEQFQPLVDDLLTRLENDLKDDKKVKEVSEELLVPLFKFTKTLGNESTTRLLRIIANEVLPNFDQLSSPKKIEVIQKIANVSNYADTDNLLKHLYEKIFLTFPTENKGPINFSIIEATLWAFMNLARKFNSTASKLIGTTICYTGQPGEADESNEDEEKHNAFQKRIEYISSVAPEFVNSCDGEIQLYKNQEANTEEDRAEVREKIKAARIKKRCGNNIRHLTRLLLSSNPLSGKLPETPSWKKPTNDRRHGSNRRDQRNNNRGRNNRFNRNSDRGNNRSRNGGRFNNNNNRQRRRFSNRS